MALADKVATEKAAVAAGTLQGCVAPHPHDMDVSDCVRAVHQPSDGVHVGEMSIDTGDGKVTQLIQWETA